eukprot:1354163-Alexandrium_andersonii.AAC.1
MCIRDSTSNSNSEQLDVREAWPRGAVGPWPVPITPPSRAAPRQVPASASLAHLHLRGART